MDTAGATSSTSVAQTPMWKQDFVTALRDGFPLSVSVFMYGIAYGALAHSTNHLTLAQTLAMSLCVFAGASQFTILALLHQSAAVGTIIASTFLLNARQALYGLTLGPHMKHFKALQLGWLAHGLTDESYSVSIVRAGHSVLTPAYFAGAGSAVLGPWLLSSFLGFLIGGFVDDPQRFGLDFAYIGAFMGLLVVQLTTASRWVAAILAGIGATLAARYFGTSAAIFVGAVISFACGVVKE